VKSLASTSATIAFVLALSGVYQAQNPPAPSTPPNPRPPAQSAPQAKATDARSFVDQMTAAGLAEVELGKLATQRASNQDVKAFGEMMVKDHTQANKELASAAAQVNVQPPAQTDQKHRDLIAKLSKLQGAEFDREYMAAMVEGHQDVAASLEAAKSMSNHALMEWATKTLPAVQRHLERAKQIRDKLT